MAIIDWEYCSERTVAAYARLFHRCAEQQESSLKFHGSPYFQIVWIRQGSGEYNVMGKMYPFRQGDVFLFAEREAHYVSLVREEPRLYMESLLFSRQFLCPEKDDGLYSDYLRIYTDRSPQFTNQISGDNPRTASYFVALSGFYADILLPREAAANRLRARLLLLLSQVALDHAEMMSEHVPETSLASEGVARAVRYMDEHFREDMTLDQLAAEAGLARNYFSAAFKRAQGISPWNYLTAKRISSAISLLVGEKRSVTEAALASGFNNTTNFNRAFRKYTGKSPTEYVRTLQNVRTPEER